jgi:hypothetical protein
MGYHQSVHVFVAHILIGCRYPCHVQLKTPNCHDKNQVNVAKGEEEERQINTLG